MEIYHEYKNINGENKLAVFVNYDTSNEFSLDFDAFKRKVDDISKKIREYTLDKMEGITDNTILLILNGIVVGTLVLSKLTYPVADVTTKSNDLNNVKKNIETKQEQVKNAKNELDDPAKMVYELTEESNENTESEEVLTTVGTNTNTSTSTNKTNSNKKQNQNTSQSNRPTTSNPGSSNSGNTSTGGSGNTGSTDSGSVDNAINSGKIVNLQLNSGAIVQIDLEEYVCGVVAGEMPAEFNTEALKAQAVAARTYALKRIASGQTLKATNEHQVYKTKDELKAMWGSGYDKYYPKIKQAVLATQGENIKYGGKYIDALYFSTSNGKTEDSVHVWGNSVAYLKSVDSSYDRDSRYFYGSKSIPMSTISRLFSTTVNSVSDINILSTTVSGRVKEVKIGDKVVTGVKARSTLGLNSADFTVTQSGSNIVFSTKGWGHGVGMSQYGANGMAKAGYSYKQILLHYYTGVTISKI